MKQKVYTILCAIFTLILCSCSNENVIDDENINIVTSFYPMYVATLNVAKGAENVYVYNLTAQTTGCLHDYQITTADMLKLNNADVLVINGDGMENFIDKAISIYDDLKIVNASEGIKENHVEMIESHDEHDEENHEHEHEHEHGENSHYWVSISLYIEQIKNIKDGLSNNNPENASVYEKNANEYIEKLEKLKKRMHEEIDALPNKNIVTFHEAFDFFAEEFDLNVVAVIEREPGTYPSAKDVAEIIDEIKEKNANAIFVEPQYSRTAADTISKETNVKVYTLDPAVTGEMNEDAYFDIMEKNLESLKEALS